VTDTSGLLVGVVVHSAGIQDRDGAGIVIRAIHDLFPWLRHLFADSVYNGPNLRRALTKFGDWTIEIVTRATGVAGFHLLPRRWVVERTLAWSIETVGWQGLRDLNHQRDNLDLHRFHTASHQEIGERIVQPVRFRFRR
jgi:transposase